MEKGNRSRNLEKEAEIVRGRELDERNKHEIVRCIRMGEHERRLE